MRIDAVVNFPFPTPPNRDALSKAEKLLTHLGALDTPVPNLVNKTAGFAKVTDLGRAMALFPISPRLSKMLVNGRQHGCLPYVITISAAMSVGDPFLREESLGSNDSEEVGEVGEDESSLLDHIQDQDIRAKEERRLKRKAFFKSLEVRDSSLVQWM